MPFWRCSTGILRRRSSAYGSGGGQTQSHFGTIAARSIRRSGTIFPTSVMVIALPSAAISLFDNVLFSTPGSGSAKAVREQSRINQLWRRYSPSHCHARRLHLAGFHVRDALLKNRGVGVLGLALRKGRVPNLERFFFPAGRPKDVRLG